MVNNKNNNLSRRDTESTEKNNIVARIMNPIILATLHTLRVCAKMKSLRRRRGEFAMISPSWKL